MFFCVNNFVQKIFKNIFGGGVNILVWRFLSKW